MEIRKNRISRESCLPAGTPGVGSRKLLMVICCWLVIFGLMAQSIFAMTANVRIEAPNNTTIFSGDVTVPETATIKDSSGVIHTYNGYKEVNALVAAANAGNFSLNVSDSPWGLSLDGVNGINSNPAYSWWNQRINWASAMLGISNQTISNGDSMLIHLTGTASNPWSTDMPIKLEVSQNTIKENEFVTIKTTYFDDFTSTFKPTQSTVHIGDSQLQTDATGNLSTPISKGGVYSVFATKDSFIKSNTAQLIVGNVLTSSQANNAIKKALNFLRKKQGKDGRIENPGVSAWAAIAFASAGVDPQAVMKTKGIAKKKQRSLIDYLKQYTKSELTKRKSKKKAKKSAALATDYARQIMAVHASGLNPRNFAGANLVKKLATYFKNGQFGNKALVNDDIFALIAYRASKVGAKDFRYRRSLKFLLNHQLQDGSFNYSASASTGEIDTTAAAIQALVLAKKAGVANLDEAINKAYNYLAANQNSDGGFGYNSSFKTSNGQSTSWASLAVIAAKGGSAIDSLTSSSGANPAYFSSTLQKSNGGFSYSKAGLSDTWATTQVIPALAKKPWLTRIKRKIKKKGKK